MNAPSQNPAQTAIVFDDGALILEIAGREQAVACDRPFDDLMAVAWSSEGDRLYLAATYDASGEAQPGDEPDIWENGWGLFEVDTRTAEPVARLLLPWLPKVTAARREGTGYDHLFDDGVPTEMVLSPDGLRLYYVHDSGLTPPWWAVSCIELAKRERVTFDVDFDPDDRDCPISGLTLVKGGERLAFVLNPSDEQPEPRVASIRVAANSGIESLGHMDPEDVFATQRQRNDMKVHGALSKHPRGELYAADDFDAESFVANTRA